MYPFLRITASLIIGVLLHEVFQINSILCYVLLFSSIILFSLYSLSFFFVKLYPFQKQNILLGLTFFILLGYFSAYLNHLFEKPPISPSEFGKISSYYVTISSKATNTAKSTRYAAKIRKIKTNDQWYIIQEICN